MDIEKIVSSQDRVLILLPEPEPTEWLRKLQKQFADINFRYIQVQKPTKDNSGVNEELIKDVWAATTILVTLYHLPRSEDDVPNLRLIHFASSGFDHLVEFPILSNTDITLTTSAGASSPRIAEWVIMTALVHSHQYCLQYEQQKQHVWDRGTVEANASTDMVRKRLGILGYGCVGRQVARVGHAMGMEVIAYTGSSQEAARKPKTDRYTAPGTGDPDGSLPSMWFHGSEKEVLHRFLAQELDILVVSVPLTPKTRHLLGAAEFEIVGKSCRPPFLSNISRGPVLDQAALINALQSGQLRGAALDVADPEPLPSSDPLWDAPNVIITPHSSGISSGYFDYVYEIFGSNLETYKSGGTLVNQISRAKGY